MILRPVSQGYLGGGSALLTIVYSDVPSRREVAIIHVCVPLSQKIIQRKAFSHFTLSIDNIHMCVYIYVCNRYMYTYMHTYMDMYMYIITIYNTHINFSSSLSLPATTAATLPATSRLDGSEGRPLAGIGGIGGIGGIACRDLRKKDRRPEDIDIWVNYNNSLT